MDLNKLLRSLRLQFGWCALLAAFALTQPVASICHAAGSVIPWGNNGVLQSPILSGLANVIAVAAGDAHSVALVNDGTVAAWGFNQSGQTNVPPGLSNVVAIAAGATYSLALQSNGTVTVWGGQSNPPNDLTNAMAIAAGWSHSLALRRDGTVVSWGSSITVPTGLSNVIAIAAGNGQSVALLADSTVVAWGDNTFGKTNVPTGLTNVVAIAAGKDHCLALKADGTVTSWGSNASGQGIVPPSITNAVAIAAGSGHSLALRANGSVAAWGDNTFNQSSPPVFTNFFSLSAGGSHSLAVQGNGSPVITIQPVSQSAFISRNAGFQSKAVGAQPLSYRWQRNGTNVAGATGSVLVLVNIQAADAGAYTLVVSNAFGTTTSAAAVLTPVGQPPYITFQPQDQSILCGEGASFQVAADGSLPPFQYQWQFEGNSLPNATSASLVLVNVSTNQAGHYTAVVSNAFGSITSPPAILTVGVVPPSIISPLTSTGKQGRPFSYTITALHTPVSFAASGLPPGLSINASSGLISGIPLESGTFGPTISAANLCSSDAQTLVLTFTSSIPVITSSLNALGGEGAPFTYKINASNVPTNYGASSLPLGLVLNPLTGVISGKPVYAGSFYSPIFATNIWGFGSAILHFSFTNGPITGLSISDVEGKYSSPYLLDFSFTLKDNNDPDLGNGVVAEPRLLSATCLENTTPISPSETAVIVERGTSKLFKTVLALDFTESIASLSNGDANGDGISDAVDAMVAGAQDFVNQQRPDAQVGVYEFHREDVNPQRVVPLTTDEKVLDAAIAGIWTNYVQWFPAASRAWDALVAAIGDLGPTNSDEQHYVIFVSDGQDESSFASVQNVIRAATNANVRIFCIGFGSELDPVVLQSITSATGGRYYDAKTVGGITAAFDQIGKDLNSRYLLRWATLKRSTNSFMPSFQITFQGLTATSPPNPVMDDTNNPIIITNTTPFTTNYPQITNFLIAPYIPSQHTGNVTIGSLRMVPNAFVQPEAVTLRASYVPRYIRQLRIHYRANWPCTPFLQSTNLGEILYGWSLAETNDGAGGKWVLISSPNPQSLSNSIPFAALGNLVQFSLRDALTSSNAFSLIEVDNTIYTNTGNQSFVFENTNTVITVYSNLPHATPVPWLIANGFSPDFAAAELSDPDGDGMLTWQEYQANTDPHNANSSLILSNISRGADGRYQITFGTSINRLYRIDASTDLISWQTLLDNIQGLGDTITFVDTRYLPGVTQIYYRVAVH